MGFSGKTVLVTGASRGIGRAIVDAFLEAGAKVVGVSTRDITSNHKNYFHLKVDLSDKDVFRHFLSTTPESFRDIDILVNNAGIKVTTDFASSTLDDWEKTMNVNLRAVYFLTQSLAPVLAKANPAG